MISLKGLRIEQGSFRLDNIWLELAAGSYAVLMGASGSGKTTILEAICGLRPMAAGSVHLAGVCATRLKPCERNVGYVPQDGVLFPTLTVEEHLSFALVARHWSKARIRERVAELADHLRIGPLLERRPAGLSGGERQRVALGRALAFWPPILCLDEPLGALDDHTREQMYELLLDLRLRRNVTVLHVTHSSEEAQRLADVVLSLQGGRITEGFVQQKTNWNAQLQP